MIMNTSTLILVCVRIEGIYCNKMENIKYHTLLTDPKSVSPHKSCMINHSKKGILVKEYEQKKSKNKNKGKQTNKTRSKQVQKSFNKS